jgi:hypothetical protein
MLDAITIGAVSISEPSCATRTPYTFAASTHATSQSVPFDATRGLVGR